MWQQEIITSILKQLWVVSFEKVLTVNLDQNRNTGSILLHELICISWRKCKSLQINKVKFKINLIIQPVYLNIVKLTGKIQKALFIYLFVYILYSL